MILTIIGNGSMARSLALGLEKQYDIEIVARDAQKAKEALKDLQKSVEIIPLKGVSIERKNILLCVKPNALLDVATHLQGEADMLISILAGVDIETLERNILSDYTIRAMPNIAAEFNVATTTLTGSKEKKDEALSIFESIGDAFWVDSEKELDIATAIAGSGPAFLSLVAEAMMDGGVKQGLKRDMSMQLVRSLFKGFGPLIQSEHPALIKDRVMSPAGTTAAGYSALEDGKVRDGFIKAIEKSFKKTQKS
ncbi:MAG: pyrroline-5-carboxylate reductase [Campylobacterales bacterium]|nr:pyrroline-5-carboxylate reductase [Campylobacterales bacterium]